MLIPIFVGHYGAFWLAHGVFVLVGLPGLALVRRMPGSGATPPEAIWLGAVALALYHVVSFLVNDLGRREYDRVSPDEQAVAPYVRIFVLHFTIVLGGFLLMLLRTPVVFVALLVALKTAFDLVAHLREHARRSPPSGT